MSNSKEPEQVLRQVHSNPILSDTDVQTTPITVTELSLVDKIPSILPQLGHIESTNFHLYDDSQLVYTRAKVAEQTPEEKRTPEKKQLLEDIETMRSFAPYTHSYQDVYTPDELHSLVSELRILGLKNRPDFNGIEDRILDIVTSGLRKGELDNSIKKGKIQGIVKRAERNTDGRGGMQWDTLIEMAKEASNLIRSRTKGNTEDYFVSVSDPVPREYPDLSKVYQFVADAHALDIRGRRSFAVQEARKETFVTNCDLINEWFRRVLPTLDRIPEDLKVGRFGAVY